MSAILHQALLSSYPVGGGATDPNFANVSLLLPFDGANGSTTFTDFSPSPKTITRFGDAQISTAQSRFGGSSLLLDGSGDYLTTPNNTDFDFGTGAFTIESFIRLSSYPASGSYFVLFDKQLNNTTRMTFYLGNNTANDSGIRATVNTDPTTLAGHTAQTNSLSSLGLALNTWYHLAWTRSGNNFRVFFNGTLLPLVSTSSLNINNSAQIVIGAFANGSSLFFNGHIDEFRITKGIARYTANFTPPSAPFPTS